MEFNQQQILALAPDDASAKAGLQLAGANKWVLKAVHPLALWGDCQGSGKNPYKTFIDLTNIAFKCSCPSRKFPCKHGLGLLLLYADNPNIFSKENALAPEVETWLNKRHEKTQPKEQKPVDEAAQKKREQARENKIAAGIDELQFWLKDVVRTGIMNLPQNPYQFSKHMIARMVDSQATGLANQLRKINAVNFYKDGWQESVLKLLSKTYLLTEAYKRRESFDEEMKEDLESLIGWSKSKEEILSLPPVHDNWMVLAKNENQEENLTSELTWLYGLETKRMALVLNFFVGNQRSSEMFFPGTIVEAELCFYPSKYPLRVLVKSHTKKQTKFEVPAGIKMVDEMKATITEIYALSPFVDRVPLVLEQVRVMWQYNTWFLVDNDGHALKVTNPDWHGWNVLATTKGNDFTCFAVYENDTLVIMSLWYEQEFYHLV